MQPDTHGVRERMPVWSEDGQRVGRVLAVAADRFEVERGFFFPKDYVVPYALVARVDRRGVTLGLRRRELEEEWERLDLYGRGERGLDSPGGRYVGVDVPGDLGDAGRDEDVGEDQDPAVVDRYHHIVVHSEGAVVATGVVTERRGGSSVANEPDDPGRRGR